ncbi:MAG: aldehyde dehydrogenase family protein [Candidatus Gygaella obscura]|nr:aldehyde dehydrogenase family protein [Candidatus Gygaella obscura]
MNAKQAVDWLDPEKWQKTPAREKLNLLKQIQSNIKLYMQELVQADCEVKNITLGNKDTLHMEAIGWQGTIVAVASNISACIKLYEALVRGKMPEPVRIEKIANDLYDVEVFPRYIKDKLIYFDRKDSLRIKGQLRQVNPLDKKGGITAVLGAGNYSSSFEMVRALFIDNCAVVHKAHELNKKSDLIWQKVFKPLVDFKALSFCNSDEGKELVKDTRINKIYFTGGTSTAKAIMASTETKLVCECGGNNPCIIVPGVKPWTKSQIKHHAISIATIGKLNGGAICGRLQTIITCKNWPQRKEFLIALKEALEIDTPGFSSYYPNSEKAFNNFKNNYPNAELIKPKDATVGSSEFLLIEDSEQDGYAVSHEAFSQVINEVALDTQADIGEFLSRAVDFCNNRLLGTLAATIIIDDKSSKRYKIILDEAITKLAYGAIGVNVMAPMIWMDPYLTWGGNEEGKDLVSGRGNFGNIFCFENVEKSIAKGPFISLSHLKLTNKKYFFDISKQVSYFAVSDSWSRLIVMIFTLLLGKLKGKDF